MEDWLTITCIIICILCFQNIYVQVKRQGSVLVIYSVTNSLLSLSFVLAGIFLPTKFKIEDATKSEYTWCGISGILFSISSVANYGMALALSVELYVSLRVTNPAARKEPLIQRLNFVLAYILPLLSIILSIIVLLAYDDNVFETIDAGGICEVSRHGKNLLALFFLRTLTEYLAIFPSCVLSVLSLIPVAKVVFKNRKLQFSMTGPCSISKESTKPNTTITTRAGPPPNSSTSANHKYLLPRNVLIRMGLWCSLLILLGIPTSVIVLYRNIKNLTDPTNTDLSFYLSPGQTDFLAIYGFTLHMVLSNGLFLLCFGTGKFANEQYRILWTTILQKIFFCCRPKSRIPRHSIISLPEVAAAYGANTTSSGSIIINTIARTMTVNSNSSSLRIKGGGGDLCVSDNSQCEKVDNTNDDGDGTENRTTRIVIIVIVLIVLFFVGLGLCIYLSVTRIKKRDNDKRTNVVNNRDFDNDKTSKKFISSMSSSKPLPPSPVATNTNVTTVANYDENVNNTTLTTTESSITSSQPMPIRGTKRKQIPPPPTPPPSIPPPSIPPPSIPPPSIPPPSIPPPSIPIPPSIPPPSIPPPSIPIPPPPILHIPPPPLSSFRKLPNNSDSYKRYMYGLGFNTMSSGANLSHLSLNRGFNNYYYRKSDTSGVSGVDEIIINENSIIIDDEGNYLNSPTIPLTPTKDCSSMHSTSSTFLYHHNGSKTNLSNSIKQSSILSSELYAPLFINNRLTAMYKAKKNKSMSDNEGNGVVENGNNSDDDDVKREETINNDGCINTPPSPTQTKSIKRYNHRNYNPKVEEIIHSTKKPINTTKTSLSPTPKSIKTSYDPKIQKDNDDSSDDRIPPSLLNKFGRNKNPLLNNYPYSEGYDPLNPRKHIKRIESAPVIPQISIDEDDAETQQIDRVMEAFAKRYHENNPELFPSSDTPYILAFSLLMLHTDAFNKSVKRKMTKEDFIKIQGLTILYDNVTFTQFIYADDDTDVNGQTMIESPPDNRQLRLFSSSKERRKSMRSRNDPYYVIQFKIPTEFKPSIHTLVPVENPYSYMGTLPSMDTTHIHRAFASAHAIRITGVQTRHNGETFNHANTLHQLEEENGTFVLKITKGGKLGRKVDMVDGRKKSGIRNWKQYGVILSGSQLMFFKDEAWPDVILMTAESIAVHDKTYKKYPNVFRLVCPKGHQYLFQAENESEMNDWITKINYAATFKSIGLKMRHSKIDELQGKISTLTSQLQNDVRFRNNLFIMMPYKTSTRDRIIQLALMVAHRIKHTCLELSRLVCYHEILEKDLCATVMEDDYYWLNRKNIPFITEKTKKSATMTLVPMSSTSSLSTMACSSPVTSIADSIQSSPPNSIGNVYLHPSDIELEIVKDDDNNGDNSKYPNNFEEKSSFRDDASSILNIPFITEKTKKSATMTLVPMSSTSSLSTMACSSPVTSIADSIQSSPPNSIGNVYLHPSDIELEIVKDDDNNGDNSKYPNNFEEKSSFRDDASSILSMEFEDAKEQIENTILFNSSS
ncbi:4506_t:CDS:10, partial [Entrophospora sp. SA101]